MKGTTPLAGALPPGILIAIARTAPARGEHRDVAWLRVTTTTGRRGLSACLSGCASCRRTYEHLLVAGNNVLVGPATSHLCLWRRLGGTGAPEHSRAHAPQQRLQLPASPRHTPLHSSMAPWPPAFCLTALLFVGTLLPEHATYMLLLPFGHFTQQFLHSFTPAGRLGQASLRACTIQLHFSWASAPSFTPHYTLANASRATNSP